jgi:hypothetical protein
LSAVNSCCVNGLEALSRRVEPEAVCNERRGRGHVKRLQRATGGTIEYYVKECITAMGLVAIRRMVKSKVEKSSPSQAGHTAEGGLQSACSACVQARISPRQRHPFTPSPSPKTLGSKLGPGGA